MPNIERIAQLDDALKRGDDQGFLLHHRTSDRWIPVAQQAVWKEAISGAYDEWRGPFDSVKIATENKAIKEIMPHRSESPSIQNAYLAERIERVRKEFRLTGSQSICI